MVRRQLSPVRVSVGPHLLIRDLKPVLEVIGTLRISSDEELIDTLRSVQELDRLGVERIETLPTFKDRVSRHTSNTYTVWSSRHPPHLRSESTRRCLTP